MCSGAAKAARQLTVMLPLKTSREMQAEKFKRCLLAVEQEEKQEVTVQPLNQEPEILPC